MISSSKLIKFIPKSVVRKVSRQALHLKKHAPHILFAGGVAGTVASTVLACRATLKLSETLDEVHKHVQILDIIGEENRDSEWHRDVIWVYGKASVKLVKLYAPSIALGAVSIGILTTSHVQMARRNTALMAAYAAVSEAYQNYRDRVREQLGEERELEIYHAARTELIQQDDKVIEAKVADPSKWSPYARIFDEACGPWKKDPELNRIFLQAQQNYCNHLLRARGHLFLNEVYSMLDFDHSRAGAVVGWVIGNDGDNYVDFGIFEAFNSRFVNGYERSIILDFNVDGVIYDKI